MTSSSSLGFRKATPADVAGTLNLSVEWDGIRTIPKTTESNGVLRLQQPLYLDDSGQVTYIVINPGGAFFGETYQHRVEVKPGANLLFAAQGATRIYKTPERPAVQEMNFIVGEGSRLEYIPDQTIAYRDADFRQRVTISVAPDSQVFVAEDVTPGWDPDDLQFTYTGMRLRIDVRNHQSGGRVCTDNIRIQPGDIGGAIHSIGYMEGASHMGSVLVLGPHTEGTYIDSVREILQQSGPDRVGVTRGNRHGISWLMVRALADSTDQLNAMIYSLNEFDRSVTTGQSRLNLRRY